MSETDRAILDGKIAALAHLVSCFLAGSLSNLDSAQRAALAEALCAAAFPSGAESDELAALQRDQAAITLEQVTDRALTMAGPPPA